MLIIRASLRDLKPQISGIFGIVDEEFVAAGCAITVLTSCWRKRVPGPRSLHPDGLAADFDSQQMPEDLDDHRWTRVRTAVIERLGDEYDVIAHGPRAHLHVEYDPPKNYEAVSA